MVGVAVVILLPFLRMAPAIPVTPAIVLQLARVAVIPAIVWPPAPIAVVVWPLAPVASIPVMLSPL